MDAHPKPYVPMAHVNAPGAVGGPRDDPARPWLALREGETTAQWHRRIHSTCYHCGAFIVDSKALDTHENAH